ncbi:MULTISPECIES: transketolase-like TK C-terminal-containing protein [unclassified Streptomyces]|uniref:Transketolase n=1 Tax=Streptomyces evansiae TaxID=3075535 RepID=A0ABU2RBX8_9ACTN|nr:MULTISPECIES: hypothetical protein [unclassified Streptomyces]EFK98034.1 transketolase [Streptomyces sp. SPB78]MDT0413255.1 transketolase [Streptomyces sp. DSM 41979]
MKLSSRRRVVVEAGGSQGWHDLLGLEGQAICVEKFGASASAQELFEHFGITREAVAEVARALV